ncbi:hypothetical protein BDY19DRAFT_395241 [Irpex rosettiformis]|uniref:Uncharacterized protein n=1 Tax=Irpex rosettiformis TaxID=378272 RepID=A0ACB8TUW2_9APHY|nr:hypothetical protein BDY19DRAFT_395241 [Irpex rosettiformis]
MNYELVRALGPSLTVSIALLVSTNVLIATYRGEAYAGRACRPFWRSSVRNSAQVTYTRVNSAGYSPVQVLGCLRQRA